MPKNKDMYVVVAAKKPNHVCGNFIRSRSGAQRIANWLKRLNPRRKFTVYKLVPVEVDDAQK